MRSSGDGASQAPTRTPTATLALASLAMLAFASNSVLCRAGLAGGHIDPASFTTIRLAGGATSLGLLAAVRGRTFPGHAAAWQSAVPLFAYALAFSLAYVRIPAGVGALLLFAAVQLTMIGSGLSAGERPRPAEWAGLGLSLTGLVVLTRPGSARPDALGACLMLASGVAWGVYSLRGRRRVDPISANQAAFAYAVPLSIVVTGLGALRGTTHVDAAGLSLALASGAITSGLGYAVWYAALRGLAATRAAIVQLSVPPLAAAGGVLALGEPLSSRLLLASLLILGGIALSLIERSRLAPSPNS